MGSRVYASLFAFLRVAILLYPYMYVLCSDTYNFSNHVIPYVGTTGTSALYDIFLKGLKTLAYFLCGRQTVFLMRLEVSAVDGSS